MTGCSRSPVQNGLLLCHLDNHPLFVELALTPQKQAQGLMYRTHLPKDNGMLFVFSEPASQSFWMKNTSIALDIGYFTKEGILREIYPLYPHSLNAVRSRRKDIQFALEVNQGWFEEKNLTPGARLDLQKLENVLNQVF